nr:SdpI family protein [Bacillus licheniformis]
MGTLVFVYVLMFLTPKIDPRRKNYQLFSKTYYILINAILLIFSLINVLVIMTGLGYDLPAGDIVPVLVGALLIVIGNYLPRVRSNFFFGIKNPWTLSSDSIWKKTHRFAAKVFTLAGLLIVCGRVVINQSRNHASGYFGNGFGALYLFLCFVPEGNQYEKLRRFKKAPIWSLLASPQKRRHCWVAAFPEDFIC